jgi:hypothetical protein
MRVAGFGDSQRQRMEASQGQTVSAVYRFTGVRIQSPPLLTLQHLFFLDTSTRISLSLRLVVLTPLSTERYHQATYHHPWPFSEIVVGSDCAGVTGFSFLARTLCY